MNSYDRMMAAITGENYDRTPVLPLIIQHAMQIAGIVHSEYSTNAKRLAEAQIYSLKKYGYDGIHITSDNQIISEAMGCVIELPFDEPPRYRSRILEDNSGLNRLKKFDPFSDDRMPVIIQAARMARQQLKDEYFIKVNCDSGPFSVAAALRGEEQFFMDIFDKEDYVFDLLGICTAAVIKYAGAIAQSGAHAITFGDSTSGLIGRELYRKFALPFQKKVIEALKIFDLPVFMHICGDTRGILDLMAETGADVLEIDSIVNLAEAYETTGRKICLEGNIDPVRLLLQGSRDDVHKESIRCIEASCGKNLILSSGCEVPRYTPGGNIMAMVEAALL